MAPSSAPSQPPAVPNEHKTELRTLSRLVHRLYHRNKNQHRRSLWWRHFDSFRRELRRVVEEIAVREVTFKRGVDMKKRRRSEVERKKAYQARWETWRDRKVGRWFTAFSQLLASLRFPSFGLVLIACLARICSLLGITGAIEAIAAQKTAEAAKAWATKDVQQISALADAGQVGGDTDLGMVVAREMETVEATSVVVEKSTSKRTYDEHTEGVSATATATTATAATTVEKEVIGRKKTKRKKRGAIDDLFSGL
ncbi:hypothetical protein P152DRAFT_41764 [Eremomyces bilateralis CBS 781.70]|uniref:RNase MRP protein 1 RNA binding domain-containing protein n=1 Tax=Eremomyces bilateralis CBS 781.70 TaxID=1392243 RepID=A0A6G1G2G6_9PEZI|nr:uncharacterized protein P152DRAFT_41764 [Eremomyces bilateralis CBS 781.70]KAF1811999.1 hypothetical protein P152DRAFT_41764 [Eremomyces bilateralis CBS 781.70]